VQRFRRQPDARIRHCAGILIVRDKRALHGVAPALTATPARTRAVKDPLTGARKVLTAAIDSHLTTDTTREHIESYTCYSTPSSVADIDHIAITPGGIWVIDAKRYKGRPELKIEGGILRPRVEKLLVGRRDCTSLVDGMLKQVDVVRDVVGDVGVQVVWPKRLAKVLTEQTAGDVDVAGMRELVALRFKSAGRQVPMFEAVRK
jgi:hypothetical protein